MRVRIRTATVVVLGLVDDERCQIAEAGFNGFTQAVQSGVRDEPITLFASFASFASSAASGAAFCAGTTRRAGCRLFGCRDRLFHRAMDLEDHLQRQKQEEAEHDDGFVTLEHDCYSFVREVEREKGTRASRCSRNKVKVEDAADGDWGNFALTGAFYKL